MSCSTSITADLINDCTKRPVKGIYPMAWVLPFYGSEAVLTGNELESLYTPQHLFSKIEATKFNLNAGSELVSSSEVKENGYIHKFSGILNQVANADLDKMDGIIVVVKRGTDFIAYGVQNGLWKTSQTRTANDNSGLVSVEFATRTDQEESYSEYYYDTTLELLMYGNRQNFVFEGNSRTCHDRHGAYPTPPEYANQFPSYPEQLLRLSNFKNKGTYTNVATWGQANNVILNETRYNTLIKPLRPTANGGEVGIDKAYLFIMTGIGDVIFNPSTVNTQIANYKAYCDRAKADGFTVVVVGEYYGQNFTFSQTAENARLAYNQAMADYATAESIDMYVDLDPIIGVTINSYFADTTFHLKSTAKGLIAEHINSLFEI